MVKTKNYYYGNLLSYKYFIRPQTQKIFENSKDKKITKHKKTIQRILKSLALNGSTTTWDLAKKVYISDLDRIRTKEKEYRRLFLGRMDRKKFSQGMLDSGLIEQEEKQYRGRDVVSYRLSPHGILVCLDLLDLDDGEIDIMATKYAKLFPLMFGK